jgi:hypothetical protein
MLSTKRTPVMVDDTLLLPSLPLIAGKAVVARFLCRKLSSGGALMALGDVEKLLGLVDRLPAA